MITRSGLRVPRRSPRTKAGEQAGLSQCHSVLTTAFRFFCFSWQQWAIKALTTGRLLGLF